MTVGSDDEDHNDDAVCLLAGVLRSDHCARVRARTHAANESGRWVVPAIPDADSTRLAGTHPTLHLPVLSEHHSHPSPRSRCQ